MTTWTIKDVLEWAAADFKKRSYDHPRLEAEVLLAHVLSIPRINLYTEFDRPLIEEERTAYRNAILRRQTGEPAAYIVGHKEFWSLDFDVTSHVLVPRPETELLVATALKIAIPTGPFLDLCTGSGCVAIALASECRKAEIDAVDISPQACEVARRNALRHQVEARVTVFEGDLFAPLPMGRTYAAITANPPYVRNSDMAALAPEVLQEPDIALAGGTDGLDVTRRIVANAPSRLMPGGALIVEIDPRQATALLNEVGPNHFNAKGELLRDLAGQARAIIWQHRAL
ncbi:MAG: peptide chain release factor N(5)-glutamine methyltransferase [Myxococcota bacterium]|nr:peptide chain release factor N(5)-glutamine methyltransferase [Myxococcota bacterium]